MYQQPHKHQLEVVHSACSAGNRVLIALRTALISLDRSSTHPCPLLVKAGKAESVHRLMVRVHSRLCQCSGDWHVPVSTC